jgi:hypothetical protein
MSKNSSAATTENDTTNVTNKASSFTSKITDNIPVSYNAYDEDVVFTTDKVNVSFNIIFGKGKDALQYNDEKELKQFTKKYNVDTLENDDTKAYYIIADEGPLIIKIDNLDIYSRYNNDKYDYALGFAVDFEEPEYIGNEHYTPFNIDRDGVMWSIPVKEPWEATNHYNNTFYQNGRAKYQWNTSRTKDSNVELTEDEKEIGIEKTSETTGLLYMTFMVLSKEKEIVQQREITRSCNTRSAGATRGGDVTRGGGELTRGINDTVAGRVGYGHSASTSSITSTFKYAKHTSRVVIPVRIRILKDSEVTDMNCSKTLKGAEVNMDRKKIVTPSFNPLL